MSGIAIKATADGFFDAAEPLSALQPLFVTDATKGRLVSVRTPTPEAGNPSELMERVNGC